MKYLKLFLWAILLTTFIYGQNCNPEPSAIIVTPEANAVLTEPPDVAIELTSIARPETLKVFLNKRDITEYFTFSENTASASGTDLKFKFNQGDNELETVVQTTIPVPIPGDQVNFFLDSKAPDAVIQNKTIADGFVTFEGILRDISDIDSMTINGVAANIVDNDFSVTVEEVTYYVITTEDIMGNSQTETFVKPGALLPDAMGFRFLQKGFDVLAQTLENTLANQDIEGAIKTQNPLADGYTDVGDPAENVHYIISLKTLTYDPPTVYFSATDMPPNSMIVSTSWKNISMDMDVVLVYPGQIPANYNVTVNIEYIDISDTIQLAVIDHMLVAESHNMQTDVGLIEIVGDELPTEIKTLVESTSQETMQQELENIINTEVPKFIDDFLTMISFEKSMSRPFPIDFYGVPDTFMTEFEKATFTLAGYVSSAETSLDVLPMAGSFYTSSDYPTWGDLTGVDNLPYDFAVDMSDDTLNQFFYTLYANNFFYYYLEAEVKKLLALVLPKLLVNQIPAETSRLTVWSDESPQLLFGYEDQDAAGKFDRLNMKVEYLNENTQEWELLMQARLNAIFPAQITSVDGQTLSINFSTSSMIEVELLQIGTIELPADVTEDLINYLLPYFLEAISGDLIGIPIPTIDQFDLSVVEVSPHGIGNDYLAVYSLVTN